MNAGTNAMGPSEISPRAPATPTRAQAQNHVHRTACERPLDAERPGSAFISDTSGRTVRARDTTPLASPALTRYPFWLGCAIVWRRQDPGWVADAQARLADTRSRPDRSSPCFQRWRPGPPGASRQLAALCAGSVEINTRFCWSTARHHRPDRQVSTRRRLLRLALTMTTSPRRGGCASSRLPACSGCRDPCAANRHRPALDDRRAGRDDIAERLDEPARVDEPGWRFGLRQERAVSEALESVRRAFRCEQGF